MEKFGVYGIPGPTLTSGSNTSTQPNEKDPAKCRV
jgi:hypothetical protein